MLEPTVAPTPNKKVQVPVPGSKKQPSRNKQGAPKPVPATATAPKKTLPRSPAARNATQANKQAKAPAATAPKPSAPQATPKAAKGILGFFKQEFTALRKLGSKQLTNIHAGARKLVQQARTFVSNPAEGIKKASSGVAAATKKSLSGARQAVTDRVKQFKAWYATPEGKAKFWKGVAMTGVAVATVATGGALTAPALALAAAVSAGGGVAAQVVENKVFNAAAKAKAKQDARYKYTARKTFQGVTPKSIAVDALVGSVGGPAFKFAGAVLVRGTAAVGKAAIPLAKGVGHLGAGVARRFMPASVKTALKAVGNFTGKHAGKVAQFARDAAARGRNAVKSLKDGAGKAVTNVKDFVKKRADAAYAKTRFTRKYLMQQTRTLRKFAGKAANLPAQVASTVRRTVKRATVKFKRMDRNLLNAVRKNIEKSPALKLGRKVRAKVDGLGNKASKKLVGLKVRAADGLDALKARTGEKLSQTRVMKYLRHVKDDTVKRLDNVVRQNPDGHYAKAILEFRASGTAIRTHLGKVWGDASQELNKDLSRLLGRHGSVQADFKNLAEKGSRELYEAEVQKARSLAEARMRAKVMQDTESAELLSISRMGQEINDVAREQARSKAVVAANDAVDKASDVLTRQAEKFVARHPTTVLEEVALKTQALEASKKAAEHYFGKANEKMGLLEKAGMLITTPVRIPINERLEKYEKVIQAVKSSTPLASVTLVGGEAVLEQTQKAITTAMEAPFKEIAKKVADPASQAKDTNATSQQAATNKTPTEAGSELFKIYEEAVKDLLPSPSLDDFLSDVQKQLHMKDED